MITLLGAILALVVFALCQGLAVVGTAFAVGLAISVRRYPAKLVLVGISWICWFVAGMAIYGQFAEGLGMFEGGLPFLAMSVSSLCGSAITAAFWIARTRAVDEVL